MTELTKIREDLDLLSKALEQLELCHEWDKLQERSENIVRLAIEDRLNKLNRIERELIKNLK